MEIIIGAIPPLIQSPPKPAANASGAIEAKLLHVRPPRKGIAGPSGMERRGRQTRDPLKARVLTIMVPDADALPKDIDSGDYKVLLRFCRK